MAETRSTCCSIPEEERSLKNRPSNLPRWGFLLLLTLGTAVSVALLIIWVMFFPKPFDMEVEDTMASRYNFTADNHLNAMFNFTLGFNNPNRMLTIYYFWLNVTIERDNQTLAFKYYSNPIVLAPRNVTFLPGSMKCRNVKPQDEKILMDLKPTPTGDIMVDIRIMARIYLWTRYWSSKRHTIKTFCSNVRVHPPNAIRSKTKHCHVNL